MVGLHQQNKQEKMSKIGIKNFRVFKEFTEFEIKPITLLTGPNNAGKSSFTKLLLLLKNGITKLNFNEGLHNLESFDKVLNWENKQDTLELFFDNEIPFLTDDFKVQLTYRKNEINKKIYFRYSTDIYTRIYRDTPEQLYSVSSYKRKCFCPARGDDSKSVYIGIRFF